MKKKIVSIILVFILIFSVSVPALASDYTDLDGHWAQEYMEDLAGRGYLTGYDNGTMRPDNMITACESLVLLSRFYSLSDFQSDTIYSDYKEIVTEKVPSSLSWAYKYLTVCLASGIITESDLSSMDLTSKIKKEQLSVFLVRTMQLSDKAAELSDTKLTFNDTDKITESYRSDIAELVSIGIIQGDDDNNFNPQSSVTRAVAATMVSRALGYLKTSDISLTIDAYDDFYQTEGIIASANSSSLEISGFDGFVREYTITSSADITVNKTKKALSSTYDGCYALVTVKDGVVSAVSIESDSDAKWVQGKIYSLYTSNSTNILYVEDLESGTDTKYTVPSNAEISQNNSNAVFSALTKNYFVTLKLENDKVTKVRAINTDSELSGSITEIGYGTEVTFKIKDKAGSTYRFLLDISDLPTIKRGDTTISIDRLSVGDEVTVSTKNCDITSIKVGDNSDKITGELTSITKTTNGTTWILTLDSGTMKTLTVDESADVYDEEDKAILLSDIEVGDTVSVVVYGSTITEIYLESALASTTKLTGTVLAIDTSNHTITLLNKSSKLIYIDTSHVARIVDSSTGTSLSLSSLKENDSIIAYGSYSTSTKFAAVTIIVED
ncbi:MAG: S-layer homology domain-containing protein [Oscillospiraceae bacterium]|nr:S-layer homology domain-containing protein [Oscillospiraceae bacterium]